VPLPAAARAPVAGDEREGLRQLTDFLATEHDKARAEALQVAAERDLAMARVAALENGAGRGLRGSERDLGAERELVRALAVGDLGVEDALRVVQAQYPERVVVLPSAWRSAKGSAGFDRGTRVLALLLDLVTTYVDRLEAGGGDAEARRLFGSAYAATEASGGTNVRARKLRTFVYGGREVLMLQHLKIGVKDSANETWRCHFMWDAASRVIVIGHCGPHLDLR
jgi:hypothetical protein